MRMPPRHVLAGVLLGALLAVVLSVALPSWAARNSSGTYTLPAGNPVVPGTPISSSWANSTLADIANELTSSLDRQGRGAMAAPLVLQTGSAGAPSLTFTGDTDTGLFRPGGDSVTLVTAGTVRQTWTSASTVIGTPLNVTAAATLSSTLAVTGATSLADVTVDAAGANSGTAASFLRFGAPSSAEGIGSQRTAGPGQFGLDLYVGGIARLSIAPSGAVHIPGVYSANPGTSITGSFGATFNIDFPLTSPGNCYTSDHSLPGVSVAGVCSVSFISPDENTALSANCSVQSANSVRVRLCNMETGGTYEPPATDFRVRVWQP